MTYTALVRYYDLENAEFTEDLDYWLELAEEHGAPILEIGCGTGRVTIPLAQRGYAVTGIDNSPEMLERLHQKLARQKYGRAFQTPHIHQTDMMHFTVAAPHALALVPFNTFAHLLTLDDQLAALQAIHAALAPKAVLAFDIPNPGDAYAATEQGLTLERTFQDGENTVQQFSSITLNRAAQLAHITWLYDATAPDGSLNRTIVPLTLRYTFPAEMRLLLERAGFTLKHLYGDYDRSPFSDGAPRLLVIASKGASTD